MMANLRELDSDSSHSEDDVSDSCIETSITDSENLQDHAAPPQQPEAGTLHCAAGQPFPKRVTEMLENLYSRGMTGWGKSHSATVEVAVSSTGLTLPQVKV